MEPHILTPKPRSEKQIEASRINGAKSRGPVTLRGRFNSTRNKARHGLLAKTVVLENESPDRFLALLRAIESRFEPADELEQALVESIAVARWRQSRVWEMERAGIGLEMNGPATAGSPAAKTWIAFRSLGGSSNPLDVINRYESRCDRQIDRAVDRLTKLRALRRAPETEYLETEDLIPTTD